MINRQALEKLYKDGGFDDFTWIDPKKIVVAQWVRVKCTFGCDDYGRTATCPPSVPSVAECRKFFDEYSSGVIFHFEIKCENPEDRHAWISAANKRLVELETKVFTSGHEKAFVLFVGCCQLCPECVATRAECKQPEYARPSPEGFAMDVFSTVREYGLPIEVLSEYSQAMNRYAFLLVE